MLWKSMRLGEPARGRSRPSRFQPFWPQPMSWMEGSVRFITMAKARAFLT
jgi:hypothetical protein